MSSTPLVHAFWHQIVYYTENNNIHSHIHTHRGPARRCVCKFHNLRWKAIVWVVADSSSKSNMLRSAISSLARHHSHRSANEANAQSQYAWRQQLIVRAFHLRRHRNANYCLGTSTYTHCQLPYIAHISCWLMHLTEHFSTQSKRTSFVNNGVFRGRYNNGNQLHMNKCATHTWLFVKPTRFSGALCYCIATSNKIPANQ